MRGKSVWRWLVNKYGWAILLGGRKMAKEKSMEGMRQMIFPYFSLTYGKLNELQLSNLEQMKFHSTFCQPIHWVVLAFSHREPSRHSFWRPPGCSLFLYENPWRKIMRNAFPIQMAIDIFLVTDQREIRNKLFSVLLFDPINHWCPRSATWVKVGLQEGHGDECALKTPTRLIKWYTSLFRWDHTEGHQNLESETNGADVWWPGLKCDTEATEPGKVIIKTPHCHSNFHEANIEYFMRWQMIKCR